MARHTDDRRLRKHPGCFCSSFENPNLELKIKPPELDIRTLSLEMLGLEVEILTLLYEKKPEQKEVRDGKSFKTRSPTDGIIIPPKSCTNT